MIHFLKIITVGIFLIALMGCSRFNPAAPVYPPTRTTIPSGATQTYLAVSQIIPSKVIQDFLTQKIGATAYGGKVFSAYQVMGTEQAGQVTKLYLWALVQEYYLENGALKEGTGSSMPVVLFVKLESGKAQIFDYKDAGEGYQYLTVNFPPHILPLINLPAEAYNQRVAQLSSENWSVAKAYFGLK